MDSSSNIRDLLTSFSPSMDLFAISTGDGRIKIWDIIKGQVQAEFADFMSTDAADVYPKPGRGHLSVDYSCMKWMQLGKKRKRKTMSSLLLLGTRSGDVLALNVSAGELKWKVSDCHPGGVNAISVATQNSCIYSAGADGMVCRIDPLSGNLLGKFKAFSKAISSVSVSPDGKLLATAAAQMKIFNCLNQKKISKLSGHSEAVRCMIFTEDGKYILSSSSGERYVAVWRLDGQQSASCLLAMEHPAVFLDSLCVKDGDIVTDFYILAVSETGICYLWHGKNVEELRSIKPTKISFPVQEKISKSRRVAQPTIYAAKLQEIVEHGSCDMYVAYGVLVKPSFEKLRVQSGTDIKLSSSHEGVLLPRQKSIPEQGLHSKTGVTALNRANAEDAMLSIPKVLEVTDSKKRLQRLGHDQVVSDGLVKKSEAKLLESTDGYEDHVDTITFCIEHQLKSSGIISQGYDQYCSGAKPKVFKGINLEDYSPQKKIKEAVLAMTTSEAFSFLADLIAGWQSRSCSGKYVLPWIYAILVNHSKNVASQNSASEVLGILHKLTEPKRQAAQSLLGLSGRLHLVTAQIGKVAQSKSPNMVLDHPLNENDDEQEDDVDDFLYGLEDDKAGDDSDESD